MYDIIIIGAGIAGAAFAFKMSKFSSILLIESKDFNEIEPGTKIFPEHNRPFLNEVDWGDKELFPRIHDSIRYIGTKEESIMYSSEFGMPYGKICYLENLIKLLIEKCEEQGGHVKFNEKVMKIIKHDEHIEVINKIGQSYYSKLLVIATGSHSFSLQKSLGFDVPSQYTGIYCHYHGDEDLLNDNLSHEYNFHINSKISQAGPFFISKGIERLFIGCLGDNELSEQEIYSKFERILNNYKIIQPYIKGLKRSPIAIKKISKHPIQQFSKDRVMILGEAAGLVSSFFYEGLVGALASAELSSQAVINNLDSDFSEKLLHDNYDNELRSLLINTLFSNDAASEYIFYNTTSNVNLLFNTYTKLIMSNKKVREYLWEAHITHHLENHSGKRDRWVGQQLFKKLPLFYKMLLGPQFIKAMFK